LGVALGEIVPKKKVTLKSLGGKAIAVDAYNTLYQFLAIIRQPDGTPLKDRSGRITSQLSGLFYRTANLIALGIKVAYVFDGAPPALKEAEIKRRIKVKEAALVKYDQAVKEGRMDDARKYAQMTATLKDYMTEDSKWLLTKMGVPWIQAPSEGEAQAAYLARKGDTDYCASQDYDSLLFGAPKLVRNLTISGRRKLPRKTLYIEVVPEVIELDKALAELRITREQLIDIGILVGTDFNPDGVKGIGPKTALKLIKRHGSLSKLLPKLKQAEFPTDPQKIRDLFLTPNVSDPHRLIWRDPDVDGVIEFLCKERSFSEERVQKTLDKITERLRRDKGRTTLEAWFNP
jgi:flap endonuclease-1